jgi:hypothetical protein
MTAWWIPRIFNLDKDIYPLVFPNKDYYKLKVFIHETGHAIGLPDLYDTATAGLTVGSWDYMCNGLYAQNFFAWHRHRLEWLADNRKIYLTKPTGTMQQQWELTPANSSAGVSLIVLCDSVMLSDDPTRVHEPASLPSKVIALEVAQPSTEYAAPQGVLIYSVDGMKLSGKNPVRLQMPPGKDDLKDAPWTEASGTYTSLLFTVSVTANNGGNWTVTITYTG